MTFFDHTTQAVNGFDWARIELGIYDWVDAILGIPVQWSRQDMDRSSYPYASLDIIAGPVAVGVDEKRLNIAGTELLTAGRRSFTLSVGVHVDPKEINGPNDRAISLVEKLRSSITQESVLLIFRTAGISVAEDLGCLDVTSLVADQWLDRATLDLRMEATSVWKDTGATYISSVELEGTLEGAAEGPIPFGPEIIGG